MARGRGQSAGLSVEQLSREALALADEQGLPGLTVRALAQRVGVSPMSIYNHFPNKEALLDAVWDQVLDAASPAQPDGRTWQDYADGFAHRLRSAALAHPNTLPIMLGRSARSPRSLDMVDQTLGLLTERGLPLTDAVDLVNTLTMFTIAHALNEHLIAQDDAPVIDAAVHPVLAAAIAQDIGTDPQDDARRFDAAIHDFIHGTSQRVSRTAAHPR